MKKHYLLSYFDNLVRLELKELSNKHHVPEPSYYTHTINQVVMEASMLKYDLPVYVTQLSDMSKARDCVQLYQFQLISLMDLLFNYVREGKPARKSSKAMRGSWAALYEHIDDHLQKVYEMLEWEYPHFLDDRGKMALSQVQKALVLWKKKVNGLLASMQALGVDPSLLDIVAAPFRELMEGICQPVFMTRQKFNYLEGLLKRLYALMLKPVPADKTMQEQVQQLLRYLNFNSVHYFSYYSAAIQKELRELPSYQAQLELLLHLQNYIRQSPVKKDFIFKIGCPGLKEDRMVWIEQEIEYVKKKSGLNERVALPEDLQQWRHFKVNTAFSVAQLGHMIRLLADAKILLNKNKKEMLRFFSFFFSSVQVDDIAQGSLQSNYYRDEAGVSKAVRKILQELIAQSRNN